MEEAEINTAMRTEMPKSMLLFLMFTGCSRMTNSTKLAGPIATAGSNNTEAQLPSPVVEGERKNIKD